MTRQALADFGRTLTISFPKAIEAETRRLLVKTAREGNAKTVVQQSQRNGIPPSVESYANRPGQTNLDAVVLPGPIVFLYDYRPEIVYRALVELNRASPVESGRYRNSHAVLLNGTQVDRLPRTLTATDTVTIVNPVPYARRLEIGKTKSGRDFVLNVPNRIYERVAKNKLRPMFRNVADIQFTYIELSGAYVTKAGLSPSYLTGGRRTSKSKLGAAGTLKRRLRRQKAGTVIMAPAIVIRPYQVKAI